MLASLIKKYVKIILVQSDFILGRDLKSHRPGCKQYKEEAVILAETPLPLPGLASTASQFQAVPNLPISTDPGSV